ncbi:hypothetical protein L873DRAFT_415913 [Choiromyces venosus 120613-1]|uniref:N-acetyltransferase domain-containing protein n=1 Tax=Choiromyces venosus 120613-1 TaxID=1336337 RepID=A0A3N4JZ87_9PEZI|nr:hypothetical protein L873DRAFT_415913 [Choiromyces venosus 120613-1]
MAFIREYQGGDYEDVVEICKLTAHPSIHSSADILPYIYAIPYITLEHAHALVLDAGSSDNECGRRVVGYIIGTPDTKIFVERYKKEYIPTLPPTLLNISETAAISDAATKTTVTSQAEEKEEDDDGDDDDLRRMFMKILMNPEDMLHSASTSDLIPHYPAHLHIDILPESRGRGLAGS